jgi:hypothetical protein
MPRFYMVFWLFSCLTYSPYCTYYQINMTLIMHPIWLLASAVGILASTALAHAEMKIPPAIRSPNDPYATSADMDYNYMAPLNADGSNYPCKGYQTESPYHTVATYQAGDQYNVTFQGSATHDGGSCQLSLSYDGGSTFKVIKSIIGGCPLQPTYDFTIPSNAPGGDALFAWTWLNHEGNREFYMNCAWVHVDGMAPVGSLDSLPNIWVANIKGVTSCSTTEGQDPVFPHAGPEVEYGGGLSSSSPTTPGDCEAGSSGSASSVSNSGSGSLAGMFFEAAAPAVTSQGSVSSTPDTESSNPVPLVFAQNAAQLSDLTTTTPLSYISTFMSGPQYTTIYVEEACSTTGMSFSPTSSAAYTTVTVEDSSCSSLPDVTVTITAATVTIHSSSTHASTLMTTTSPQRTSSTTSQATSSTVPTIPYATDPSIYLPCVPGVFLCTSATDFLTCSQTNSGWTWLYSRTVAGGMECLPFLSPMSSSGGTASYGQEPGAPVGYYRDDRYVRYRPYGPCPVDGALQCANGGVAASSGQEFWVCDQGGWVDMGMVAAGTECANGEIVAS